jgi:DNA-binding winged helix-turn-helix (wHTH) protein/tetratricopeptide (TPR) repeat protein
VSKSEETPQVYDFGPFRLNAKEGTLLRDGERVKLTPKVIDTLRVLVERNGRIVAKDDLMEAVWPGTFVEESNLASNVSLLRKALGENADGKPYIETLAKRGYCFAADVTEVSDAAAGLIVRRRTRARIVTHEESSKDEWLQADPTGLDNSRTAESLAIQEPKESAITSQPASQRKPVFLSALAAALIATFAGVWFLRREKAPAAPAEIKTLAILPFKELVDGPPPGEKYLGIGMTDALITRFGNVRQIVVRPTSSVRKYADDTQDSVTDGRELDVQAVLEGNIQRSGDRVRVTVQLLRVADSQRLWSDTFDDRFVDVFSLQDSISEKVLAALKLRLGGEEQERFRKHYTDNVEAYQLYLKGEFNLNKFTPEGMATGIADFNRAIEIDPKYALAYAGLAGLYATQAHVWIPPKEGYTKAKIAAERAVEIDDSLAEAHEAAGLVKLFYDWDFAGAEREFKRAIELNPSCADAHSDYSCYFKALNRYPEEIAEAKRGQEVNPLSAFSNMELGEAYYMARRYDEAIEQIRKTLELDPYFFIAYHVRARAYEQKKMYAEAIADCREWLKVFHDDPLALATLGHIYATMGRRREAEDTLTRLHEISKQQYVSPYWVAVIHAGLGEKDQAFEYLEKAFADRYFLMIWLNSDPRFDNLRSEPRFVDLVQRIGLK